MQLTLLTLTMRSFGQIMGTEMTDSLQKVLQYVFQSREEVGCTKASMLNDVRGTSQTRKRA